MAVDKGVDININVTININIDSILFDTAFAIESIPPLPFHSTGREMSQNKRSTMNQYTLLGAKRNGGEINNSLENIVLHRNALYVVVLVLVLVLFGFLHYYFFPSFVHSRVYHIHRDRDSK
jgi:hypothetical protein